MFCAHEYAFCFGMPISLVLTNISRVGTLSLKNYSYIQNLFEHTQIIAFSISNKRDICGSTSERHGANNENLSIWGGKLFFKIILSEIWFSVSVHAQSPAYIEVILAHVVSQVKVHPTNPRYSAVRVYPARGLRHTQSVLTTSVRAFWVAANHGIADPVVCTEFMGTTSAWTCCVLKTEEHFYLQVYETYIILYHLSHRYKTLRV